ncbi:MAG: hypothetical protein ACI4GY_10005 [Acutalibacteraceae bacterium]
MSIFRNKKSDKKPVKYNYNFYYYNDIDYDKIKSILVEINKSQKTENRKNNKVRTFIMKLCNGILYSFKYFLCIYTIYLVWTNSQINIGLISKIICTVFAVVVAIGSFLSMLESYDDNEKEVHKYYDSNIGYIALVIALIALFKGA